MAVGNSRYSLLKHRVYDQPAGQAAVYMERRFPPVAEELPLLALAQVQQGSRLDLIAARSQGDPLLAWRIADANNALNPFDLTDPPGRVLRIPRVGR